MARILPILALEVLIISSLPSSFLMILVSAEDHHEFVKSMNPEEHFGLKKEKLTHFRLYWHDVVDGPNPTAVTIVQPPVQVVQSNSSDDTQFGMIKMTDNALTQGPEPSSKLVGRAQGFYGSASQEELSFLMAMNFVIIQGKYNGSAITLTGRNLISYKVREMSVIGGSGFSGLLGVTL